jgi:hypothetical protein
MALLLESESKAVKRNNNSYHFLAHRKDPWLLGHKIPTSITMFVTDFDNVTISAYGRRIDK